MIARNIATTTTTTTNAAHAGVAWHIAWSPSGALLASCGNDRTVALWALPTDTDTQTQTLTLTLLARTPDDLFQRTPRKLAWSPDEKSIAVACFDATTIFLTVDLSKRTLAVAAVLEGHENEVKGVAYSASGALLATCSRDKTVWVWECEADWDLECVAVLSGHQGDVKTVKWHPTSEVLVSASYDNTIRVWQEESAGRGDDWYCSAVLTAHKNTVWDVAFDPTGTMMASVSADNSMIVWRCRKPPPGTLGKDASWSVLWSDHQAHTRPVYAVDWSRDTDRIVTAGGDDAICVYKCNRSLNTAQLHLDEDDMIGGEDAVVTEHNAQFSKECVVLSAHKGDVNSVAWSPKDGSLFASCGDDGSVKVWKLLPN